MFDHLEDQTPEGNSATPEAPIYEQFMDYVTQQALDTQHTDPTQYTNRFSDALPVRKLKEKTIVVVGAGGIGSPTVKNLVAMGAKQVIVVDDDIVEPQNIGTQYHRAIDLGRPKVEALRDNILTQFMTEIYPIQARVESYDHLLQLVRCTHIDILIGAVDNMEFRNQIANDLHTWQKAVPGTYTQNPELSYMEYGPGVYIDARMSLGLWNVFTLPTALLAKTSTLLSQDRLWNMYFDQAVFPPEEGMAEPCTARALGYTGENIASYISAVVDYTLRSDLDVGGKNLRDSELRDLFKSLTDPTIQRSDEFPFKWHAGFDARGFITTDINPFLEKTKSKLADIEVQMAKMAEQLPHVNNTIRQVVNALPPAELEGCLVPDTPGGRIQGDISKFYLDTGTSVIELHEGMHLTFLRMPSSAHTGELPEIVTETVAKIRGMEHSRDSLGDILLSSKTLRYELPSNLNIWSFDGWNIEFPEVSVSETVYPIGSSIKCSDNLILLKVAASGEAPVDIPVATEPVTKEPINKVGDMLIPKWSFVRLKMPGRASGKYRIVEVTDEEVICEDLDSQVSVHITSQQEFEDYLVAILALV